MWTSRHHNSLRSCSEQTCLVLTTLLVRFLSTPQLMYTNTAKKRQTHATHSADVLSTETTNLKYKMHNSQFSYNLRSCTLTMTGGVLSTHCCILRSGHSFGASGRLCVCTSAGRGHAAQVEAHIEAQRLLHPPAKARSQPGNCDCSSTHSEPQLCEHPHLCAVRSHNQRLGKQKGIDTHKHIEEQTLEMSKGPVENACDDTCNPF